MVAYQEFVSLSQSSDSEERGMAAHLAALAYLDHTGPADEHAALYAALVGFLEDNSVKVRAALAYGLLHSPEAPRPIMLALLHDSAVIARAVVQYSPVLVDADLLGLVPRLDVSMLLALAQRDRLGPRLIAALVARDIDELTLKLLRRTDLSIGAAVLEELADKKGADSAFRGALLSRRDLPPKVRLTLVRLVSDALRACRMVKGALAKDRLDRILRDGADTALAFIGEREAVDARPDYVSQLLSSQQLNTRVLLHAIISGHVMFFADCLGELAQTPRDKVFAILETGTRPALAALLSRCGLNQGVQNLLARLVLHARATDLADDAAARHYVVTALTEELIAEHDGVIPEELEEAFAYLSEQNILLARRAARGVMMAFAGETESAMRLPQSSPMLALPAA